MIADDNYLAAEGIKQNIDWNTLNAEVVYIASSGQEAIDRLKSEPVDLLISDIEMPNMDGITLSSKAFHLHPGIKIILISAYDKFEYAKQAVRLGVCDYIEKPVDYMYLTEKIQSAFSSIEREQKNLALLNESKPLMVTKFFHDLLYHDQKNRADHYKKYIQYLDLRLDYSHFAVIRLEIENAALLEESEGIVAYQIELLNLIDILEKNCLVFDQIYHVHDFNSITFIIAQNSKTPAHFQHVIHKTISSFMEECQNSVLNVNVGIGTLVNSIWKLYLSYENACHALKYRFFYPHKNIFDALEATGKEFSLLSFSESSEDELIRLLCQKDLSSIKQWLKSFFQELTTKYNNKNIIFIRIYSLLGKILKFLFELNIDTSDLEQKIASAYSQFDSFHTYEQFYQWMNQICILVCQKLDTSLNSYHNQLCELVNTYIKENFEDNALCLNDIAQYTNVSPAYLSALFKKHCGQSISDTITGYRIHSACHYLTKTTLPLKEISIKCGYANQYYFSNSFKKKMGMSPSTYREQHSSLN